MHKLVPVIFGGIDLSLTATGLAKITRSDSVAKIETSAFKPKTRGYVRVNDIVDAAMRLAFVCDFVAVEGLITHARGSSLTDLAGLWWIVTRELHNEKVPWTAISPPTLKKYATGKGTADKFAMHGALMSRLGEQVETGDEADALWAAHAAADHFGHAIAQLPKLQRDALHAIVAKSKTRPAHPAINWPEISLPG